MVRGSRILVAVVTWGLMGLVGCASPGPKLIRMEAATLPADWVKAESTQDGVSIGVPQGWIPGVDPMIDPLTASSFGGGTSAGMDASSMSSQLPSDSPLKQMAAETEKDAKEFAEKETAKLREKGVILYVRDSSRPIPGEERTHYTVKRTTGTALTLDDAAADVKKKLLNEGQGKLVQLPIGPAVRFESTNTSRGGDKIHEIIYALQDGATTYNIRFVAVNNPSVLGPIADEVAKTFRIHAGAK